VAGRPRRPRPGSGTWQAEARRGPGRRHGQLFQRLGTRSTAAPSRCRDVGGKEARRPSGRTPHRRTAPRAAAPLRGRPAGEAAKTTAALPATRHARYRQAAEPPSRRRDVRGRQAASPTSYRMDGRGLKATADPSSRRAARGRRTTAAPPRRRDERDGDVRRNDAWMLHRRRPTRARTQPAGRRSSGGITALTAPPAARRTQHRQAAGPPSHRGYVRGRDEKRPREGKAPPWRVPGASTLPPTPTKKQLRNQARHSCSAVAGWGGPGAPSWSTEAAGRTRCPRSAGHAQRRRQRASAGARAGSATTTTYGTRRGTALPGGFAGRAAEAKAAGPRARVGAPSRVPTAQATARATPGAAGVPPTALAAAALPGPPGGAEGGGDGRPAPAMPTARAASTVAASPRNEAALWTAAGATRPMAADLATAALLGRSSLRAATSTAAAGAAPAARGQHMERPPRPRGATQPAKETAARLRKGPPGAADARKEPRHRTRVQKQPATAHRPMRR
jgi:hypothetical protein